MAQMLLIKNDEGTKRIGDPVSIQDDDHIYDPNQLNRFTHVKIPGKKEDITALSLAHRPEIKYVYLDKDKYYEEDTPQALFATKMKELWKNGEQWNELKQTPYKWGNWDGEKFVSTVTRHLENLQTVITVEAKLLEKK